MAKVASVNVSVTNGAEVIWNLINLLISNGWTKAQDSDGQGGTYSPTGQQVTGPGSGNNGLNNPSAWVALVDPGGERKYFFQRGSGAVANWWIRYSRNAAFGGTPDATTMPETTDIQSVHGTSATGLALFGGTASYYTHAVAETTAAFGVYQFWFACTALFTGALLQGGMYVQGLETAPYSGGLDLDPAVLLIGAGANSIAEPTGMRFWLYYGLVAPPPPPTPVWVSTGTRNPILAPATIPSVWTGNDLVLPTFYSSGNVFLTAVAPFKGQGTWLWTPMTQRVYPDTINLNTDAYVYIGINISNGPWILCPWPNGVVPQL
jgi:hypothetical protein